MRTQKTGGRPEPREQRRVRFGASPVSKLKRSASTALSQPSSAAPKAIVLAAGEGRSLYPLTKDRPKALLRVGGQTLLERLARQFQKFHISELIVVAGYASESVAATLKNIQGSTGMKIEMIENKRYPMTNTLYSLSLARSACEGRGIVVVDGDLIVEDRVIASVLSSPEEGVVAVDSRRVMGQEEVKARVGAGNTIVAVGKGVQGSAESLGILRLSAPLAAELFSSAGDLLSKCGDAEYYEPVITHLCQMHRNIKAIDVKPAKWAEIDFMTDFEEALRLFGAATELKEFRASRRSGPQYLFCPGPVLVSSKVKEALVSSEIGHRETEFSELLNRVRLKLGQVYGVTNFHEYSTVVITGSGSAANEAVLGSAGQGKRLLIISNGEFGERWIDLAEALDLDFDSLKLRWGQPYPVDRIDELLRSDRFEAVVMVHHETSTGMLNPLPAMGDVSRRYGKQLFVDAVSSLGAEPVDIGTNGVTFCTGSANKAIASVPGLSFVCGRRTAFDRLKSVKPRSLYLDLYRHFLYNDTRYQTPNTPPVNLFFALESALDGVLDGGIERTFQKYRSLASQLRSGLRRLGFRFLIPEEHMSSALTTVELPAGFSADEFHERLKRLGYITYPGKGILKERAFQVANLGEINSAHVTGFLRAASALLK